MASLAVVGRFLLALGFGFGVVELVDHRQGWRATFRARPTTSQRWGSWYLPVETRSLGGTARVDSTFVGQAARAVIAAVAWDEPAENA